VAVPSGRPLCLYTKHFDLAWNIRNYVGLAPLVWLDQLVALLRQRPRKRTSDTRILPFSSKDVFPKRAPTIADRFLYLRRNLL
jgi:hypothetical protein